MPKVIHAGYSERVYSIKYVLNKDNIHSDGCALRQETIENVLMVYESCNCSKSIKNLIRGYSSILCGYILGIYEAKLGSNLSLDLKFDDV